MTGEDTYRTRTGKILTEEDIAVLAEEAERGYDPEQFRSRVPESHDKR